MCTKSIRERDVRKSWYVVDAENIVLGRLAAFLASRLKGKHKPFYTPHVDCGDNIIVFNAEKIALTGNKLTDKKFYWHTGYPGGIKNRTMDKILDGKFPQRVLSKAVERMLAKGPLGRKIMKNLRIYSGPNHPHEAQRPEVINFSSMNVKNLRKD